MVLWSYGVMKLSSYEHCYVVMVLSSYENCYVVM
jgi:hypothetical protein